MARPRSGVAAQTVIDRAATEAGRNPGAIRRIYNIPGAFSAAAPARARESDESVIGPPEHWAEGVAHFALDLGFSTFLLIAPPDPDMLRIFSEDVAQQVRRRVATARGHGSSSVG